MVLTTRFKVLCAVAAAVGVYIVASGPDTPPAVDAAASGRADLAATDHAVLASVSAAGRQAAPHPSSMGADGLLARLAHRVSDSNAVEALFHVQSWYVAPPPPPLPFTVMGSYARPGEATVFFFTRGDRVFDVHVGDTIDNIYSVDRFANGQLTLTYKPLNIQQTLPVGDTQ